MAKSSGTNTRCGREMVRPASRKNKTVVFCCHHNASSCVDESRQPPATRAEQTMQLQPCSSQVLVQFLLPTLLHCLLAAAALFPVSPQGGRYVRRSHVSSWNFDNIWCTASSLGTSTPAKQKLGGSLLMLLSIVFM